MTDSHPRYLAPGWVTRHVMNPTIAGLTRAGISIWGSRELRVRGRTSGLWRSVPVNVLSLDGQRYLVAPRGQTQWVQNLRVAGGGELRVGARVETFSAVELPDTDKVPVLRGYLKRWKAEVGIFFAASAKSSDTDLLRIAPDHPVFLVTVRPAQQ